MSIKNKVWIEVRNHYTEDAKEIYRRIVNLLGDHHCNGDQDQADKIIRVGILSTIPVEEGFKKLEVVEKHIAESFSPRTIEVTLQID